MDLEEQGQVLIDKEQISDDTHYLLVGIFSNTEQLVSDVCFYCTGYHSVEDGLQSEELED